MAVKNGRNGVVQAWVEHKENSLALPLGYHNIQTIPHKKHKQHYKHHQHSGGAAHPSSGVDLMNLYHWNGGRAGTFFLCCCCEVLLDSIYLSETLVRIGLTLLAMVHTF
jgi:hypothetical protein